MKIKTISVNATNQRPPGRPNLMRVLRRRLGLSQRELAYLIGYDSESQISRLESGSREPHLQEMLAIERVFDVPARKIFPQIWCAVSGGLSSRVKSLRAEIRHSEDGPPRLSHKATQLERVLALLKSQEVVEGVGRNPWLTDEKESAP